MPLPKKLFVKARAMTLRVVAQYKGETDNKVGLAAVPVDLSGQLERGLESLAREERLRLTDADKKGFFLYMQSQGVITKHPWGGWMVPQEQAIPPLAEAKKMVTDHLANITR